MMMMTSVVFMTMIGAGAGNGATPAGLPAAKAVATAAPVVRAAAGETGLIPFETCLRVCYNCDHTGNPVACAVCALCSQPALAGSTI